MTRASGPAALLGLSITEALRRPTIEFADIASLLDVNPEIGERVAIEVKIEAYVLRSQDAVYRAARQEEMLIPPAFVYETVSSLSHEAREKFMSRASAFLRSCGSYSGHHAGGRLYSFHSCFAARASGDGVSGRDDPRLRRYVELLLVRNKTMNVTGARDEVAVWEHIDDALTLAPYVREPHIDIGSGGGFPGIPLAVACDVHVTFVESIVKKARFWKKSFPSWLERDGVERASRRCGTRSPP